MNELTRLIKKSGFKGHYSMLSYDGSQDITKFEKREKCSIILNTYRDFLKKLLVLFYDSDNTMVGFICGGPHKPPIMHVLWLELDNHELFPTLLQYLKDRAKSNNLNKIVIMTELEDLMLSFGFKHYENKFCLDLF